MIYFSLTYLLRVQSAGPVIETNLKVAHAGTQTMFSPTPTSGESQQSGSTSQDVPDTGGRGRGEEASSEVRRQRRRTQTRERTQETRHERREHGVTESVAAAQRSDNVTFVEIEAQGEDERRDKEPWKFDRRKWIAHHFLTRCHSFVSKCALALLTFIVEICAKFVLIKSGYLCANFILWSTRLKV